MDNVLMGYFDTPQGMVCPKCGCAHLLRVTNTYRGHNSNISRRRKCRNCGTIVLTNEEITRVVDSSSNFDRLGRPEDDDYGG